MSVYPSLPHYRIPRSELPAGWIDEDTLTWIATCEILLFTASIINTIYLFTRTRHYQLLGPRTKAS
jgi:hypothetical protein